MQRLFDELIQLERAIENHNAKVSNKLTEDDLIDFVNKFPSIIPSFEEYKKDIKKKIVDLEKKIDKVSASIAISYKTEINRLQSLNLEESYLSFIKKNFPSFEEYKNDIREQIVDIENKLNNTSPYYLELYNKELNRLRSLNLEESYLNCDKEMYPSFERYKNGIKWRIIDIEKKINYNSTYYPQLYKEELQSLQSLNLAESYLSFIEEKNPSFKIKMRSYLPWWKEYFRLKNDYASIKKKFCEEIILRKNQEEFIKDNLLNVFEIVHHTIGTGKLLEVLPKPTEEEYCKAYFDIVRLSKKWDEDNMTIGITDNKTHTLVMLNEEELINIFKERYRSFINDIKEIKHFYQIAQFKIEQKEREEGHTNLVRMELRNYLNMALCNGISEDELDIAVKSHFNDKYREDLITYVVKNNMNEFYEYFEKEFNYNTLTSFYHSSDDELYYNNDFIDENISSERFDNIYDSDLRDREEFNKDYCL